MTAFFPVPALLRYLWLIEPLLAIIVVTALYIASKYGLEFSALLLAFWSLTVATSFIALVI